MLVPLLFMNPITLFDFTKSTKTSDWQIVDDVVMGGVSSGRFKVDLEGNGVFYGTVSVANNGGFSSFRHQLKATDIKGFTKVNIRLKGDGKSYQFRIKEDVSTYFSYITTFKTTGKWENIELNINDLYPSFRGRNLNLPNFSGAAIEEIVFLIGNKKEESFQLVIDKITLVK